MSDGQRRDFVLVCELCGWTQKLDHELRCIMEGSGRKVRDLTFQWRGHSCPCIR